MEMLIIVAIWTFVVKRGVEDILHAARGNTPNRYKAASARRQSGAAGRYWSALWDDTFDDMLAKHTARRARRQANPSTPRPRGAATQFFAGWFQDGRRAARRKWEGGWTVLDEKRREKATRPRPGQETVPGQVVPNAPSRPDPQAVPAEDGADLQDGPAPGRDEDGMADLDEDGIRICKRCRFQLTSVSPICENCMKSDPTSGPDFDPDQDISPTARPTTEEGPTMTTMPTTEVVGLESAIRFCEDSSQAYTAMVYSIEQTRAALANGDVSGPAADAFDQAMEMSAAASAAMVTAANEMKKHRVVAEAYDAVPGAGTREFVRAGR